MNLPQIMVAPNGARRTKDDHRAIPMQIEQTVATAQACYNAGAGALHAHVRDPAGRHVLDAGLYRELLQQMQTQVPQMMVQITTEAVGIYDAATQRQLVRDVMPQSASAGLREILSDGDEAAARSFYHFADEADIAIQHILYDADDVRLFQKMMADGIIPDKGTQMIFVLGRYTTNQESLPAYLDPFLETFGDEIVRHDWAVCAFGRGETDCLLYAHQRGGKCRVGFENSLWRQDGTMAASNEEKVATLVRHLAT